MTLENEIVPHKTLNNDYYTALENQCSAPMSDTVRCCIQIRRGSWKYNRFYLKEAN